MSAEGMVFVADAPGMELTHKLLMMQLADSSDPILGCGCLCGTVTPERLAERLTLDPGEIRSLLDEMVDCGVVELSGSLNSVGLLSWRFLLKHGPQAKYRPVKDRPGFVYAMATQTGTYKIGRSGNPGERRLALQGRFGPLTIVRTWEVQDMVSAEQCIHDALNCSAMGGEEFNADLDHITELATKIGLAA